MVVGYVMDAKQRKWLADNFFKTIPLNDLPDKGIAFKEFIYEILSALDESEERSEERLRLLNKRSELLRDSRVECEALTKELETVKVLYGMALGRIELGDRELAIRDRALELACKYLDDFCPTPTDACYGQGCNKCRVNYYLAKAAKELGGLQPAEHPQKTDIKIPVENIAQRRRNQGD
jgi:hypothetical protein